MNTNDKPRVLLVEDDQSAITLMKFYLRGHCQLDTAMSGEEALSSLKTCSYHAVLTDIDLGDGISGVDLLKEIRSMDSDCGMPVIALTGFMMPKDIERFRSEGFSGFFPKPYQKDKIVAFVQSLA